MFWKRDQGDRIHPTLDSIGPNNSQHQRRTDAQTDLEIHKANWKFIGSIISSVTFVILLLITSVVIPIILTKVKHSGCSTGSNQTTDGMPSNLLQHHFPNHSKLCAAKAKWDSQAATVAGFADGSPSILLSGLQMPNDLFVLLDGTILVVDSNNNRITKWEPNAIQGELLIGTGFMGSWRNLLTRPIALAVRDEVVYVSDAGNYRLQMFPLNSNQSSPDGKTILGEQGEGFDIDQIEEITSIIAPIFSPSILYLADSKNHRILLWDSNTKTTRVIAGRSNVSGSDSHFLHNPTGIALNERANILYVADKSNNRIQKCNMDTPNSMVTVAGWNQLNSPHGIQFEPFSNSMFIADTYNHRVLLWKDGETRGRTIAGTGTQGNGANQLNNPVQVRLDEKYNLYVADMNNNRIQRFNLIYNGC